LCYWATCNLRLHFSGTLLGSARRTGLLPVCGRNLYNCLCSLFFCSLLYPLHIDSELTQTLNYFKLWTWGQLSRTYKKKFPKTQFNPPFLWFFSPSVPRYFIWKQTPLNMKKHAFQHPKWTHMRLTRISRCLAYAHAPGEWF